MGLLDFLFGKSGPYTRKQEIIHSVYHSYRAGCNATRALREASKYADGIIRQERHQLYLRGIDLNADILDIRTTKSGNNKLWLNISGAGVNTVTIRNMDKFVKNYGTLHTNQRILVKVAPYRSSYTFRIKYNDKSKTLKGKNSSSIKSKKVYGGGKLFNPEKEVQFEKDDYDKMQLAFEESSKGNSLCETAIVSEDKSSFERGMNYLKNAVQIIKNININRFGYGSEHKLFKDEKIARGNFSISNQRWEWAKNVELENTSGTDKKNLYKKVGELALEYSKVCKIFSEILLQQADTVGHKKLMYLHFFNLASAYKLFYLNNSNNKDIELAKKYIQKSLNINRILPIEQQILDEDTMNSVQEALSQIPASKELTDTFLSVL